MCVPACVCVRVYVCVCSMCVCMCVRAFVTHSYLSKNTRAHGLIFDVKLRNGSVDLRHELCTDT